MAEKKTAALYEAYQIHLDEIAAFETQEDSE